MNINIGDFKEFGPRIKNRDTVIFTFAADATAKKIAINIFDKSTKHLIKSLELSQEYSIGLVYSVEVNGINPDDICYLIEQDSKAAIDPYASAIVGRDTWADVDSRKSSHFKVYSGISHIEKCWKDTKVEIKPADMILYKLHMRGFTAGFSMAESRVGTGKGVLSKLSYLKDLGVTSLEVMPLYDFEELFLENKMKISPKGHRKDVVEFTGKTNYWGFGEASYFAPKASYFGGSDVACDGLRNFVSTIHSNGMEIIMEMSFATETSDDRILDCLEYYVKYYHIDGFHIVGCNAPIERIAADPFLGNTKIFYEYIPEEILCSENGRKHLFIYNDSFMNVTRQIQNHMNGSMVQFANHMRRQNGSYGFVNYMANVNGFSLWDSYSYGEKHNMDNGEENRDGTNSNYSFNYGCEGKTSTKAINENRFREMRNAFTAVMMSQAVPLLVAADEAAATHLGNNNPYCQDNKCGYTVFTKTKNKQLLTKFVKELINFRKEHKCIRPEMPFSMNDYQHLGLPDMSFHGAEPWTMTIGEEQKALGVLYAGAYAKEKEEVYICYNFHYDEVEMALPLLAPGKRWRICFNTAEYNDKSDFSPKPIHDQQSIKIPGSSISVLVGLKV